MTAPVRLADPLPLGSRRIRNRTMHLGVNTGLAVDHRVEDRLYAYWRRRAEGGVGAVVTGLTPVHPAAIHKTTVLKNTGEEDLPALHRFADAVSGAGALSLVQLVHNGSQLVPRPGDPVPVSPSGVPTPGLGQPSRALTAAEIRDLVTAFADAADRCRRAGVDGVEVHGAHGFLLHQFLSPLTNRRRDAYGGSRAARARFAREVLRAVRDRVGGDLVIGFRMVATEYTAGGITEPEALETAAGLAADGLVDYLSVSAGNYGTLERAISPYPLRDDAPLADLAGRVRAVAGGVPVVAANRLLTPAVAGSVLAAGQADIIGLGRPLIADPDWPARALDDGRIRPCIACNACFAGGGVTTSAGIECAVNPDLALGTEREPPSGDPGGAVLVAGAGVAGLAFALEATRLGLRVTVREQRPLPGGQVARYDAALTGGLFGRYIRYAVETLAERGVQIAYGERVEPADLADGRYAAVVLATGAVPRQPPAPALTSWDLLADPPSAGTVLLLADDPGPEPLQLAYLLVTNGCRVHAVAGPAGLSPEAEGLTRHALSAPLTPDRFTLHRDRADVPEADIVVHCAGREPDRLPYPPSTREVPVRLVGDCDRPAGIAEATRQAYAVARELSRLTRPRRA